MMRTPTIFEGQPRIVSLLILGLYCVFGPYMQNTANISRPNFPWKSLAKFILAEIFLATFFYFLLLNTIENIWILFSVVIMLSLIASIASLPSEVSNVFITIYQIRGPSVIRKRCKQVPSCSEYMKISISKYGWIKGTILGWKRLLNCDGKEKKDWP
jgi:putative component of membrane protein insertase Oxa1/YidC/SpoIIIJ protein YidD